VDGVGLGHPHIGSGALEPGEATGKVADLSHPALSQATAKEVSDRVEAKDVADLEEAAGPSDHPLKETGFGHRSGKRFLHKTVLPRLKALNGQGKMGVCGGHEIHSLDLVESGTEVLSGSPRVYPEALRSPGEPGGVRISHPRLDP